MHGWNAGVRFAFLCHDISLPEDGSTLQKRLKLQFYFQCHKKKGNLLDLNCVQFIFFLNLI